MTADHLQWAQILTACFLSGVIWSVLCRLLAMHPGPASRLAAIQHMVVGAGAVIALLTPYGMVSLSGALFVFFAIGARRWAKGRAPGSLGSGG